MSSTRAGRPARRSIAGVRTGKGALDLRTIDAPAIRLPRALAASEQLLRAFEITALLGTFALLAAFVWPIAQAPPLSSDSGTALSVPIGLLKGDFDSVVNSLLPPLQTAVYALLLALGWMSAIEALPATFSLVLAAALSYAAYRAMGSIAAAVAPLIVLCFSDIFWRQTGSLPFYPAFVLLGYAGLYAGGVYILTGDAGRRWAIAAGLLLALSLSAFTIGLVFLPVPALLQLCYWSRDRLQRTLVVYGFAALFTAPWFAWHFAVAGRHFYHHPYSWFTDKYLTSVLSEFEELPLDSLADYLPALLESATTEVLALPVWALVLVGLFALQRTYGNRALAFVLLSAAFLFAGFVLFQPAPHGRYFYPLLPLVVLLAGAGLVTLCRVIAEQPRSRILALLAAAGLLALVTELRPTLPAFRGAQARYYDQDYYHILLPAAGLALFVLLLAGRRLSEELRQRLLLSTAAAGLVVLSVPLGLEPPQVQRYQTYYADRLDEDPAFADFQRMQALIDDSKGIIGRDAQLQALVPENRINTVVNLSEEDYVTYLSWQSEVEVLAMLREHDIGWVILYKDAERWERDNNFWLVEAYGREPRHYLELRNARSFHLALDGEVYQLYKVGPL